MRDCTAQRFAVLDSIKQFDGSQSGAAVRPVRDRLEPTLTPATWPSVKKTHITSDILTILALFAMELRRRRLEGPGQPPVRPSAP
jgi:hypothetical protein